MLPPLILLLLVLLIYLCDSLLHLFMLIPLLMLILKLKLMSIYVCLSV